MTAMEERAPAYNAKWSALSKKRLAMAKANQEPCGLCGKAIDYQLHGNARMGATTDHVIALADGGELLPSLDELRPAHRLCQAKQGARITNAAMKRNRMGQFEKTVNVASLVVPTITPPAVLSTYPTEIPVEIPAWVPIHLQESPEDSCFPRLETAYHPEGVGSYGPALAEWVEQQMGVTLRWWQQYALMRLLEHDVNGALVWQEAAISTARQSGKSILLRSLAMGRIHHPDLFGIEEQTVLHVANVVGVVTEVAFPALAWAQNQPGYYIRRTNGEIEVRTPTGGRYLPRSSGGAYGFSSNLAMADECWDLKPVVVNVMISPTLLEREMPQMVLFSTAHPTPTELFPSFRLSSSVEDRRLLLEWSAAPDDDIHDVQVWRKASPHWSPQRELMLSRLIKRLSREDFTSQHLNIWPAQGSDRPSPFPKWSSAPACIGEPPSTALVALDQTHDGQAVAIAAMANGCLWYRQAGTLREAADLVTGWGAEQVIVGMSLKTAAVGLSLPVVAAYGARESAQGLPLLVRAVALGEVTHEHRPVLDEQFTGAVLKVSDGGITSLSVKDSSHRVIGPKLASWLLLHERDAVGESPAIF